MRLDYSGKFVLRLPTALHGQLAKKGMAEGKSLNKICIDLISLALQQPFSSSENDPLYPSVITALQKKFGKELLGVLLFGSQVTGMATEASDVDFLIALSKKIPLTRGLYRWWDEKIEEPADAEWNPQFVNLPVSVESAGSLWFEAATAHKILWENGKRTTQFLDQLKKVIDTDQIQRHWSNGHPFWVWRKSNEK